MTGPWDDDRLMAAVLAAEQEESDPDPSDLGEEDSEHAISDGSGAEAAASGITSHVLARNGIRITSKSSFKPPHTTEAVWTRVAFFTEDTVRLVLSDWKAKGPANPHQTLIQRWYFDNRRARKAVVLWWMNGNTWRRRAGE